MGEELVSVTITVSLPASTAQLVTSLPPDELAALLTRATAAGRPPAGALPAAAAAAVGSAASAPASSGLGSTGGVTRPAAAQRPVPAKPAAPAAATRTTGPGSSAGRSSSTNSSSRPAAAASPGSNRSNGNDARRTAASAAHSQSAAAARKSSTSSSAAATGARGSPPTPIAAPAAAAAAGRKSTSVTAAPTAVTAAAASPGASTAAAGFTAASNANGTGSSPRGDVPGGHQQQQQQQQQQVAAPAAARDAIAATNAPADGGRPSPTAVGSGGGGGGSTSVEDASAASAVGERKHSQDHGLQQQHGQGALESPQERTVPASDGLSSTAAAATEPAIVGEDRTVSNASDTNAAAAAAAPIDGGEASAGPRPAAEGHQTALVATLLPPAAGVRAPPDADGCEQAHADSLSVAIGPGGSAQWIRVCWCNSASLLRLRSIWEVQRHELPREAAARLAALDAGAAVDAATADAVPPVSICCLHAARPISAIDDEDQSNNNVPLSKLFGVPITGVGIIYAQDHDLTEEEVFELLSLKDDGKP